MLKKYLGFIYIRYFFLILLALIFFFVGLDFIQNIKSLPSSANLQILYLMYKSFYAIDMLLPISIIFSMIAAKIYLIRSNALVALYSVGYSKKDVIKPFFLLSILITLFFIFLHTTSFSYANENANNIRKKHILSSSTSNLFFKYNDYYIYFKKLYPFYKKAEDIKIFKLEDKKLKEIIRAREAFFEGNSWKIESAKIIKNLKDGVKIIKDNNIVLLDGFKPKILDFVYEGKTSFTLLDALYAIKLLKKQKINTQKIKAVLYSQLIYPFFAPILLIIIFYFVPITQRLFSITLFSFIATIFSLVIWGILFALVRLSYAGVIIPEIGIIFPVLLLSFISFFLYKRF